MEEIKTEETKENPVEETTAENPIKENPEKKQMVEKATPEIKAKEPKEEYSESERRLYARMKRAEEEAKEAKAELAKAKVPISDIDAILEVQSSTQGLDPLEISELKLRATAGNMSLTDARKDTNFQIWQSGYRVKVEKENAAKPSTLQPEAQSEKTFIQKLNEATLDEKAKLLAEKGLWKNPRRRPASERISFTKNQ